MYRSSGSHDAEDEATDEVGGADGGQEQSGGSRVRVAVYLISLRTRRITALVRAFDVRLRADGEGEEMDVDDGQTEAEKGVVKTKEDILAAGKDVWT